MFKRIFRFYRVGEWWWHLFLPVLGFFSVYPGIKAEDCSKGIFAAVAVLAYGYAYNSVCEKKYSQNMGFFIEWLFSVLPLLIVVFFLNHVRLLIVLIIYLVNTLYSSPRFMLKKKYWYSVPSNALIFSLIYLLGIGTAIMGIDLKGVLVFLYVFFNFLIAQLIHELAHAEEDSAMSRLSDYYGLYYYGMIVSLSFLVIVSAVMFFQTMKLFFLVPTVVWFIILVRRRILKKRRNVIFYSKYRFLYRIVCSFLFLFIAGGLL